MSFVETTVHKIDEVLSRSATHELHVFLTIYNRNGLELNAPQEVNNLADGSTGRQELDVVVHDLLRSLPQVGISLLPRNESHK